jgi:hypothetical protein
MARSMKLSDEKAQREIEGAGSPAASSIPQWGFLRAWHAVVITRMPAQC